MRVKVQKPTTNPMLNFAHFWLCPHRWGQARKEAEKETMPGPRDRKEMEAAHMSMQKPVRAHPLASPQGPSSPPGVHLPSACIFPPGQDLPTTHPAQLMKDRCDSLERCDHPDKADHKQNAKVFLAHILFFALSTTNKDKGEDSSFPTRLQILC